MNLRRPLASALPLLIVTLALFAWPSPSGAPRAAAAPSKRPKATPVDAAPTTESKPAVDPLRAPVLGTWVAVDWERRDETPRKDAMVWDLGPDDSFKQSGVPLFLASGSSGRFSLDTSVHPYWFDIDLPRGKVMGLFEQMGHDAAKVELFIRPELQGGQHPTRFSDVELGRYVPGSMRIVFLRRKEMPVAPKPAIQVSPDDPVLGQFSMADATSGLAGKGALVATLDTDLGTLTCKLFDDRAPITAANFVGLARGVRPWKDNGGRWVKKPAYDGTTFHRIIRGFMIQGGDALGDGTGEPGYVIPDELWPGARHDRAGLLCMANRGPNTNGAQFFITDASAPHLDSSYTIFGECGPVDLVHKLARVEVQGETPRTPPRIKSVRIQRAAP